MNHFLRVVLNSVVHLAVLTSIALAEESSPVVIGGIFCLTGEIASGCNAIREGAEVALDLVNRERGIRGHPLQFDIQDSHYTPRGAHTLATRFAANPNILGVLITGIVETKAAASPLERSHLPYITLWDSAPEIEELGDYSFGIGPWLPSTYEESAKFAYHTLNKRRAATIATNAEWSLAVSKGFQEHFRKLGGGITIAISTIPGDPDFRSILLRVLQTKPEVIYAPITEHLIPFFRQLQQLRFQGSVITSDNLTEDLLKQAQDAFEGAYQTMVADPDTEEATRLAKLYEEKFSRPPPMLVFHGWGYDGVRLMAEALRKSDFTRKSVRDSLLAIRDFRGAGGTITFTSEGSWRMPISVFKVSNGKFILEVRGQPE